MAICPDCNKAAKFNDKGKLACECEDKEYGWDLPIRGSEDDERLLASIGLELKESDSDTHYWGDGIFVYLYPNHEWSCDSAPDHFQILNEYVASVAEIKARTPHGIAYS